MKISVTLLIIGLILLVGCTAQAKVDENKLLKDGHPATIEHLTQHTYVELEREQKAPTDFSEYDDLNRVTMRFEGMTCPSCSIGIESEIQRLDGVAEATVDYPTKTGFVIYDPNKITSGEIQAFASKLYPAKILDDEKYQQ